MNFQETMEWLKNFVDSLEGRELLTRDRETFIKVLYEMERQFLYMEKSDKKPVVDEVFLNDIHTTMYIIRKIYTINVITKNVYSFAKTLLLLISNWNKNVLCDQKMELDVTFLSNLFDNHMTVVESFNILKSLIQRCERLQTFA
jgi:hypothetical protein